MGRRFKEAKKKASDMIRSHDLFSHQVEFNFNNRGGSHSTVLGGAVSFFIIKAIMCVYTIFLLSKVVNFQGAAVTMEYERVGAVDFNLQKTNTIIISSAYDKKGKAIKFDELAKNIRVKIQDSDSNESVDFHKCAETDFEDTDFEIATFEEDFWDNSLCMEYDQVMNLKFNSKKDFEIQIEECLPDIDTGCEEDRDKRKAFTNNLMIDFEAIQYQIDLSNFTHYPAFQSI